MGITVNPISNISVRVNQNTQPIVQSTSTFYGSKAPEVASIIGLAQGAFDKANGAYDHANAAYSQANYATSLINAQITYSSGVNNSQNNSITSNRNYFQSVTDSINSTIITNQIYFQGISDASNTALSNSYNTAISYQSGIANSVFSVAVGGAPSQSAQTWKSYTISQIFDTILFPTIGPSYTIPTISLTANNTGTLEIGQIINQQLAVNSVKNDAGIFTQLRIARNGTIITTNNTPSNTVTSSIGSQYGYNDPNNPNYQYGTVYIDPITITSGTTSWTGYGNYSQGQKKLNNKGTTDTNSFATLLTTNPQSANAVNFATSSSSITGIYPYFWGVSSTQPTAATIAAAIVAGTANKVLAVGSGTLTITFNASGQYVWFAIETGYAVKTTWYNTSLNNGSIGAGQFILSPVAQAVNSPQSYWTGVPYNVYISSYATSTTGSIQFS